MVTWTKAQAIAFARFMRKRVAAERQRDAEPIRKARSEAWRATFKKHGSTEDAIAAANAAEVQLRAAT